jgi:hypothetical protein
MRNFWRPILFSITFTLCGLLFFAEGLSAKIDLSIGAPDVVFSKDEPLAGEIVRIFARVFNVGDQDVYGDVLFLNNGGKMTEPQPISVRANTYDDVFIDWQVEQGSYDVEVRIVETRPLDENLENNTAIKENYFVDFDTDKDGVGNSKDFDDDNDGLSDEIEKVWGTDPLVKDTDADGVSDKDDAFPLDATETKDTDNDGVGNNVDQDDDNDGLKDEEELWIYETNPLEVDTDRDELTDKEEVGLGTNPLKADTDGDGVLDLDDLFPLDETRAKPSMFAMVAAILESFKNKGLFSAKILLPASFVVIVILLLFLSRRRRRYRFG